MSARLIQFSPSDRDAFKAYIRRYAGPQPRLPETWQCECGHGVAAVGLRYRQDDENVARYYVCKKLPANSNHISFLTPPLDHEARQQIRAYRQALIDTRPTRMVSSPVQGRTSRRRNPVIPTVPMPMTSPPRLATQGRPSISVSEQPLQRELFPGGQSHVRPLPLPAGPSSILVVSYLEVDENPLEFTLKWPVGTAFPLPDLWHHLELVEVKLMDIVHVYENTNHAWTPYTVKDITFSPSRRASVFVWCRASLSVHPTHDAARYFQDAAPDPTSSQGPGHGTKRGRDEAEIEAGSSRRTRHRADVHSEPEDPSIGCWRF
ncbi:hypothetical protein BV25DRAFT_824834 [Artomyces pyxidatus]|uniref:Uncharacterized protein n=1 Tax=Artomyces pyxidatus TaxID=48021 RepID=A0ACB8SYP1_9AGAM|nr:hypothetical protein BV25DRAFT_824834 [Artomyces pyxidatus]